MREKRQKQIPLMAHILDHPQSQELEIISGIIDANPIICERLLQDLSKGKSMTQRAGAKGMSADQVLRCAIVKILFGFTYEELAFHIIDSQSLRWFCRIGIAEEGFKKSALNRNIKTICDQTWEMINRDLLGYSKQEKIENPAVFEKIKAGTNSGWFDYHWKKPNAKGIYTKNCYFERAGDMVIFAGIYGDKVK